MTTRWLIVGAGTAGCVVAARLAAAGDNAVTLVERGPDLTRAAAPPSITTIDYTAALATERVDRSARVRRTSGGELIGYPVGRGVGGSSAVNGMLMERGDLAQYRAWGWADVDDVLARVKVPVRTVTDDELGPIDQALRAATSTARNAALARDEVGRVTAADAYLDPVRGAVLDPVRRAGNVTVLAGRQVESIAGAGGRVTGVRFVGGGVIDADAVVVCAGAIGTPLLLLRSGIAAGGIGEGLSDHPSATINVRLHEPQPARSPLVTTGVIAGDDRVQVTAMRHVGVAPGERALGAVTVALLRPRSRGHVSLLPDGSPRIEMGQYGDAADLEEMIAAVELLEQRVSQLGDVIDEATIDDHGTPVAALDSPDAIVAWLHSCWGTYVHAAASCPIGRVLDDDGRVHGFGNLYVADASAFPEIPAAPTYLPTLALAERIGARIVGGR